MDGRSKVRLSGSLQTLKAGLWRYSRAPKCDVRHSGYPRPCSSAGGAALPAVDVGGTYLPFPRVFGARSQVPLDRGLTIISGCGTNDEDYGLIRSNLFSVK